MKVSCIVKTTITDLRDVEIVEESRWAQTEKV